MYSAKSKNGSTRSSPSLSRSHPQASFWRDRTWMITTAVSNWKNHFFFFTLDIVCLANNRMLQYRAIQGHSTIQGKLNHASG